MKKMIGGRCGACLLSGLAIGKDVFDGNVKLAHIILAEAVLIPANSLEQQALDTRDW